MAGLYDLEVSGLAMLQADLKRAGDIPDEVTEGMVNAQAEIVEKAIVYTAGTMLKGPYWEGDTARSVKKSKPKKGKTGTVSTIKFKGTQHGNRNAEVAFVNEYGKKSQSARPFIKTAVMESADPAANEARKILDQHLEEHRL